MPAMTPDEWKELATESVASFDEFDVVDGELNMNCEMWVPVKNRHRVAALALHEQPFGFTRADVEMLDDPWGGNAGRAWTIEEWHALRDRIAALLTPEAVATPLPFVSTMRSITGIQTLALRGAAGSREAIGGVSFNLKDDAARESFGAAYLGFVEERPHHFSGNFPDIPNGWYRVLSVNMYESSDGALRTGDVTFTPTQAPEP